jgi:hypothetical protein
MVIIRIIILFLIMLVFLSAHVGAYDLFTSDQLSPSAKTYLVLKDVNVRGKPRNRATIVGRLKKNNRINSSGKAKGTRWISIEKGGINIGFVYGKALVPVIDGRLLSPITSNTISRKVSNKGLWPCHYKIRFIGKVKVENSLQVTSDYNLEMECEYRNKTIEINATMFLTELPYLKKTVPIYQINVDLYDIPMGAGDMFSTTVLYHTEKNKISFDRVNKEGLQSGEKVKKKEAADLSAALRGAVAMAHQSWGPIVWSELARPQRN